MSLSMYGSLVALTLLYATSDDKKHRDPAAMIVMTKRKLIIYVASFAACQACVSLLRTASGNGYVSAWLRRGSMLIALEYGMLACSALIWNRVTDLLPKRRAHGDAANRWRRDALKSMALLWLMLAHVCLTLFYFLVGDEPHWIAIMCFVACALYIHMTALSLGASLAELCMQKLAPRYNWGTEISVMSSWWHRIVWCSRIHTLMCIVLSVIMVCIGMYTTSLPPVINEVPVRLRRLPAHLDNLRVALVTDVHIGPTVGRSRMQTVVATINSAKPDIVAIVGDLTDGDVSQLHQVAEPIGGIESTRGVFYVTGNHEYYHGRIEPWLDYLKRNLTVVPLRNEARRMGVHKGGKRALCLAGVDDISAQHSSVAGHAMNASAALAGCVPGDTVVVLAHQPAAVKRMLDNEQWAHSIDLLLAGHTHAGQMYVVAPLSYMINAYFHGLYSTASGAQVYVSAGVNYWGPPVKMWRLTEVPMLVLRSAAVLAATD